LFPPSLPSLLLQYIFTITPANGGPSITLKSPTPNIPLTGLAPSTQYKVTVVGLKVGGGYTPPSNTLSFVTAPAG